MTESVWGRWTQYVSPLRFIAFSFSRATVNNARPRFSQKVYEESNYFTSADPIDVYKNHLHYEVVGSWIGAVRSRGWHRRRPSSPTRKSGGWLLSYTVMPRLAQHVKPARAAVGDPKDWPDPHP